MKRNTGMSAVSVIKKLKEAEWRIVLLQRQTKPLAKKRRFAIFAAGHTEKKLRTLPILLNGYMMQTNIGELAFMVAIRLWEEK